VVDLSSVESFVAATGADVGDDAADIQQLITAFSAAFRSETSRDITIQSYSRTFDGLNNTRIMVPQYPIVTVESVSICGRPIAAQSAFGLPGFRFDQMSIILNGYRFDRGEANISVSWHAGFATVPADIEQAINDWVSLKYANRGDRAGWSSMTLAGQTVALITKAMPDFVMRVANSYRSVVPT